MIHFGFFITGVKCPTKGSQWFRKPYDWKCMRSTWSCSWALKQWKPHYLWTSRKRCAYWLANCVYLIESRYIDHLIYKSLVIPNLLPLLFIFLLQLDYLSCIRALLILLKVLYLGRIVFIFLEEIHVPRTMASLYMFAVYEPFSHKLCMTWMVLFILHCIPEIFMQFHCLLSTIILEFSMTF